MLQYGSKTQKNIYKTIDTIYNGDSSCLLISFVPSFHFLSKSLYTLHIGVNTEGRGVNNIVEEKNTFLNSCAQCKFSMILVTNPNQFHFWYCLLYLGIWKHISPIELWVGTI